MSEADRFLLYNMLLLLRRYCYDGDDDDDRRGKVRSPCQKLLYDPPVAAQIMRT